MFKNILCGRPRRRLASRRMPYTSEHKARTRERIIHAARQLFNRHGFEAVSIDQIMARAKLTRGGFYHHFPSKDALYVEAVRSFTTCSPFAIRLARSRRPQPEPRRLGPRAARHR